MKTSLKLKKIKYKFILFFKGKNAALDYLENVGEINKSKSNKVWSYIERGKLNLLLKSPDMNQAFEDFSQAIELDPQNIQIRALRAQVLLSMRPFNHNYFNYIEKDLKYILRIDPDNEDVRTAYGIGLYKQGLFQRSITELSNVINRNPECNTLAFKFRGKGFYRINKRDMAFNDFGEILARQPENTHAKKWLQKSKPAPTRELLLSKEILLHPHDSELLKSRALVYIEQGKYTKAIHDLSTLILQLDSNANELLELSYQIRGQCFFYKKNWSKAMEDFEHALEVNHNQAIYTDMALLEYYRGNYALAATYLTTAINNEENSIDYLVNNFLWRARAYLKLGDFEKAREDIALSKNISMGYTHLQPLIAFVKGRCFLQEEIYYLATAEFNRAEDFIKQTFGADYTNRMMRKIQLDRNFCFLKMNNYKAVENSYDFSLEVSDPSITLQYAIARYRMYGIELDASIILESTANPSVGLRELIMAARLFKDFNKNEYADLILAKIKKTINGKKIHEQHANELMLIMNQNSNFKVTNANK